MNTRHRGLLFGIAACIIALDQLTKWIVVRTIPLYGEVVVIPKFFAISHVTNKGAAFSLFANGDPRATWALAAFSVVVMAVIIFLLARTRAWSKGALALALILGGAAGNFIDRVRLNAVVDFLAFDFGSYHWPDFNVADSAIVIGAVLLAIDALFGKRDS
jgi:signal peptidase II